jgi:ribosomal protein L16/L10AE
MQREAAQLSLQRLVTGGRCEVPACYELALWLVVCGPSIVHLCAKHTRVRMAKGVSGAPKFSAKNWV